MRDDELRRVLTEANPWWRAGAQRGDPVGWTSTHRLLKDRTRHDLGFRPDVLNDLATGPVTDALVILTGPRRVGKSVALLDLATALCRRPDVDVRQIIHTPCDGLAARDLRRVLTLGRDLTRVVDRDTPGRRIWLLDEVSMVPGWTAIVKAARDGTDFGDNTVVVTGSRWRRDDDIQGNLLAGRGGSGSGRRLRHLLPMTFRDFLRASRPALGGPDAVHPAGLQDSNVADALETLRFDVDAYDLAWQEYLTCGGFPRAAAEQVTAGAVSDGFVRDLAAWLQRDVSPDSAAESLPLLLDRIAARMTSPLNVRESAEELSASRTATTTKLNRLVASFAAIWCHQHDEDGKPIHGAQSKLYLADPILSWLPSRLRAGLVTPDMPTLTEATVGVALARATDQLDEGRWVAGDTIGYVRTGSGNKVDLGPIHLPSAGGSRLSVPIEAKWVDANWRSEARVIEQKYGAGVVATKSVLDLTHKTWAVPAPLLALLLG
jgi:predicted AAA+ superfamily ATPase